MSNVATNKFLQPLIEELGIKGIYGKRILAALVYKTLQGNPCGLTVDNTPHVEKALYHGICSSYEFSVLSLAAYWSNDLLNILAFHEPTIDVDTFYKEHIWPYLRKNEVVPGVHMTS